MSSSSPKHALTLVIVQERGTSAPPHQHPVLQEAVHLRESPHHCSVSSALTYFAPLASIHLRRRRWRRLVHAAEDLAPRRDVSRGPSRGPLRRDAVAERMAALQAGRGRRGGVSPSGLRERAGADDLCDCSEPIRASLVQIAIISNHLNGKDTHVRGVQIFAPLQCVSQHSKE